MRLLGWQKVVKNTMRGFLDIEIEAGHGRRLQIFGCVVHVGANGPSVALPSKAQLERDGTVRRKPGTNKVECLRILRWGDQDTGDLFSRAAIKLLLAHHPDALDAGEAA